MVAAVPAPRLAFRLSPGSGSLFDGYEIGNAHFHLMAEHRHYYDTDAGDDYPPDGNAA